MNSYLSLFILFLIIIILIIILYLLRIRQENFLDYNIPFPSINNNNNRNNYQFIDKSPYVHFLQKPEKNFLGWYKWRRNNIIKACIPQQDWNKKFQNFLNSTVLTYDGLWKRTPVKKDFHEWKIRCPPKVSWKLIGTKPQQYWQPSFNSSS